MNSLNTNLETLTKNPNALTYEVHELVLHIKGKNQEHHYEAPHFSHYEHTHNSHSPWGSLNSWNKVPKVEMHKFDGLDSVGWISQMDFSLHNIQDDETKIHVWVLYLNQERWKLWKWHNKCYPRKPTWTIITKASCAHFDKEYHFLGWLMKLKQKGSVADFIIAFQ
jgi:hypothetical protein